MNYFTFAIAVAAVSAAEEKPEGDVAPEIAADYIQSVLNLLFSNMDCTFHVRPMKYPKCGKIPLIIASDGMDESLLWYYPQMSIRQLAIELESVLHNFVSAAHPVPA